MKPFKNVKVEQVFVLYPPNLRDKLLALRELIFETADSAKSVGELEETLKWGEPAYITSQTKSGGTMRIDRNKSNPAQYEMCFNCQTNLIDTLRTLFPSEFNFEGNRPIIYNETDAVPIEALTFCIAAALTYHRNK